MYGRTALVGNIGSFDKNTYRVIIDSHVLPFLEQKHGETESFVLQEDNCGPHRATTIATYLQSKGVARMKWPAQSSDLNPVENIWGIIKTRLWKRDVLPRSPMHLFQILTDIWNSLPDCILENLVASMPKRAKLVRKLRGKSAKY